MALTKEQKQNIIEDLKEKIARQKTMVFVDFKGLKVKDFFDLRKRLKDKDCGLTVCKKTLLGLALKEKKFEVDMAKLEGQLAVVFGFKDEFSPAKVVFEFSQTNPNLKILAGFFEKEFRGAEEILTLAQLPSREELLARFVGSVLAPISNFVQVLQGNIKGLIYALKAIKK